MLPQLGDSFPLQGLLGTQRRWECGKESWDCRKEERAGMVSRGRWEGKGNNL